MTALICANMVDAVYRGSAFVRGIMKESTVKEVNSNHALLFHLLSSGGRKLWKSADFGLRFTSFEKH